ncbi:T9SS type A sorting domain-containing protein [Dyadobacter sediminis]|nr:T9SS type A sorting domain-containing protein [Dyadobacter sediminis]
MKKYWITMLSMGLSLGTYAQTPALYNNGAGLYISPGAKVRVNGDFLNQEGSNLENEGMIAASGNVTNFVPMNQADAGELLLEGSSPQKITGSPVYATNVTVDNAAGVVFSTPVKISGSLSFVAGILTNEVPENAFTFGPDASVSTINPPTNTSHINGFVAKQGEGAFVFPVGNGLSYQPVGVDLSDNPDGLLAKYEEGDAGNGAFTNAGSMPLVARNAQEYWTLTPVSTAEGTVSIYWDQYNNTGITNIKDLAVAHLVNGSWINEGDSDISGNVEGGFVTSNIISKWSPFTLGSTETTSPLPVRLTDFTARWAEGTVALDWKVSDAVGFERFEIERSINAVHYERIGQLAYNGQSTFQFSDSNPLTTFSFAGKRYYRLKMVDTNGSFAYSRVRSVDADGNQNGLFAFPNPSRDVLHLNLDPASQDSAEATIISVDGKAELRRTVRIIHGTASIDTSSLAGGVYLLSLRVNGREKLLRFVKQ